MQRSVDIDGVVIPLDPSLMSPLILESLTSGKYEKAEARSLPAMVEAGDRILDLGGGIGFLSVLMARQGRAEAVVCVEANPDLAAYIRGLAALNGVAVEARTALLATDASANTAPFHIHRDLWASTPRALPAGQLQRTVDVETVTLQGLARDHRATMAVVDIEVMRFLLALDDQAFIQVWRDGLKGSTIDKVVIEFHGKHLSPAAVKRIFDALSAAGFAYDPALSRGSVVLLRRVKG